MNAETVIVNYAHARTVVPKRLSVKIGPTGKYIFLMYVAENEWYGSSTCGE